MVYPLKNRPTTLQIDYHALRRRIGTFLGFGRSHADWDDEQNMIVDDVIDEGVRLAYYPPPLAPPYAMAPMDAHEWSFMRPTWTFTTVADQRRYAAPQNFERPIDNLAYQSDNHKYPPVMFTAPARLQMLEGRIDSTGPPEWAAIEPGSATGESPQEPVLVLHPTPDAEYELSMQYQAAARRITADQPYALGGQMFGPVLMSACLAAAELQTTGQAGGLYADFTSKLASAIVRDRQRLAGNLGYNSNGSPEPYGRGTARKLGKVYYDDVTYGGAAYDD